MKIIRVKVIKDFDSMNASDTVFEAVERVGWRGYYTVLIPRQKSLRKILGTNGWNIDTTSEIPSTWRGRGYGGYNVRKKNCEVQHPAILGGIYE